MDANIIQFLEEKTILVTGATGFVAKIFVEKILRVQPKVKKIYLLLRTSDANSATQRLHDEVISTELFKVLREMWGENFSSFISEKVVPVSGNLALENLGIKESYLMEEMFRDMDLIVNSAATTNFNERYEVAMDINTFGPTNILNFAKKCAKVKMFLHLSTAYVCGEKAGVMPEKPFYMGETLNGTSGLDINAEKKLAEERLKELKAEGATEEVIKKTMRDLGIERAKKYGWPNTYVFTKSMGEMLLGHLKESMPVVIIRPTIVTCTYKEPFPCWIEGTRTMNAPMIAYGKGYLSTFLGHPDSICDYIPGDMVVNSMIIAMVANANHPADIIYQVGSSVRNPMISPKFPEFMYKYFSKNPWTDKNGKTVRVRKLRISSSIARFRLMMAICFMFPFRVLQLLNLLLFQCLKGLCINFSKKINLERRFGELFGPYLLFKATFDDLNTERLRILARESGVDEDMFFFDPKCIDWEDYFLKCHIPGVVKYLF